MCKPADPEIERRTTVSGSYIPCLAENVIHVVTRSNVFVVDATVSGRSGEEALNFVRRPMPLQFPGK